MRINRVRSLSTSVLAIAFLLIISQTAFAGSPLLCHPFDIGQAKSLPVGSGSWKAINANYDTRRLVDDATALLTSNTPIIVRMETLRRATLYVMNNEKLALELHSRLATRAQKSSNDALAQFDLGYLEETYKQATVISSMIAGAKSFDGYSRVVKAISLRGGDADMEFAAALIASHPKRKTMNEHLQRSIASATDGSMLGRNLVQHFSDLGTTLAQLKARFGVAKN
jgi:hypothetical protein